MYQIGFVCQNKEQADRLRRVVNSFFEMEERYRIIGETL